MKNRIGSPLTQRSKTVFGLIFLFFVGSILATIVVWYIFSEAAKNRDKQRYLTETNNVVIWINSRLLTYIDLLTGVQAFVENSQDISLSEWEGYIEKLGITKRYPGLRSINFLARVSEKDKANFIKNTRNKYGNDPVYSKYFIKPIDANYTKSDAEYYPVLYTTGLLDDRFRAIGADGSSEKERAEALFLARDTEKITTTSIIKFIVKPTNNGFSLVFPLYNKKLPRETIEQRRKAFTGAVYAPFDIDQYLDAILLPNSTDAFPEIDMEIYDVMPDNQRKLIYDKDRSISLEADNKQYLYTDKRSINLPSRRWEVLTGLSKKYVSTARPVPYPLIILFSGMIVSFTTLVILLYLYRSSQPCLEDK